MNGLLQPLPSALVDSRRQVDWPCSGGDPVETKHRPVSESGVGRDGTEPMSCREPGLGYLGGNDDERERERER